MSFESRRKLQSNLMIRVTVQHIQHTKTLIRPKHCHTHWEGVRLEMLGVPIKKIERRRGKCVLWKKLVFSAKKLNVDGLRK